MQIIAEVKTHSPFGWQADKSWDELFEIAATIGDIISIHTDPRWHGSFDLVTKAHARTAKPILAKGIHATDEDLERAFAAGATYALVVGRIPEQYAEQCLIEPYKLTELAHIPPHLKAVWNSRDLRTGGKKLATFTEARTQFGGWLCQASNIMTPDDIDPEADAVLIGTHLAAFAQYDQNQE